MTAAKSNFFAGQQALYEATRAQAATRQEQAAVDAQLQAIAAEKNVRCASYAPSMNHQSTE